MQAHTRLFTRCIHPVYSAAMSTSIALLALLENEPAHGYTLKHKYDRWFAQKRPLAYGQVYSSLGRLERDGLAELLDITAEGGPERRRYRITPEGVTTVQDWLYAPQAPDLFATSTLFNRVTIALLSGRSAEQVLDGQRAAHQERMRDLQRRRRSAQGAELLALTYEIAHLDADLRWIDESEQRIDLLRDEIRGESDAAGT